MSFDFASSVAGCAITMHFDVVRIVSDGMRKVDEWRVTFGTLVCVYNRFVQNGLHANRPPLSLKQ